MFETLESRRLMSVAAYFADGASAIESADGTLVVKSPRADTDLVVQEDPADLPGVHNFAVINNLTSERALFSGVSDVVIHGSEQHNKLAYFGSEKRSDASDAIGVMIHGSDGADDIIICDLSAAGGEHVDAGKGDDVITLLYSNQAMLMGGEGNDTFNINAGNLGLSIAIYDYSGTNTVIQGGGGDDVINLFDSGNFSIDGGRGIDQVTDYTGNYFFEGVPAGLKSVEVMTTES